jgi:hypothetical protein
MLSVVIRMRPQRLYLKKIQLHLYLYLQQDNTTFTCHHATLTPYVNLLLLVMQVIIITTANTIILLLKETWNGVQKICAIIYILHLEMTTASNSYFFLKRGFVKCFHLFIFISFLFVFYSTSNVLKYNTKHTN